MSPEALAPSGGARCPVCRDRPFDGVAAQPPGAPHLPRTCPAPALGQPRGALRHSAGDGSCWMPVRNKPHGQPDHGGLAIRAHATRICFWVP